MNFLKVSALALFVAATAFAGDQQNRFESTDAGFSVEKPAAWRFASLEQVRKGRASVRLNDEELQKQSEQFTVAPLVVIMKHDEPFDGLNPSLQVVLRPVPASALQASPKQILELLVPSLQRGFPDFKLDSPIREFTLADRAAAEALSTFTVKMKDGKTYAARGRMIVVPRGKFMFLISTSAPREGADKSSEEFDKMIGSVRISK